MDTHWTPLHIAPDTTALWHLGPLTVFIRRQQQDWLLAHTYCENDEPSPPHPLSREWAHYPLARDEAQGQFAPLMPDRPLVVRPHNPLVIAPDITLTFYISIPLRVQLHAGKAPTPTPLQIFDTQRLTDTWFGDTFTGEFCYALKSRALRQLADPYPHCATCPLILRNTSKAPFTCDKLCIRPAHLHTYQAKDRLWTDAITLTYHSKDEPSETTFSGKAPHYAPDATLLAPPIERPQRTLLARAFRT